MPRNAASGIPPRNEQQVSTQGGRLTDRQGKGPSTFPVTGLAATLRWELANSMALVAAIADGVPGERAMPSQTGFDLSKEDGALLAVELSAHSRIGRIAAGVWSYIAQFTEISQPTPSRGNGGHYVLFESAEIESFAQSRARLFARAGRSDDRFNQVATNIAVGVSVAFAGRDGLDSTLALGATRAGLGNRYRRAALASGASTTGSESVFELTYQHPLTDWLTIQPGIQYIANPGADGTHSNALVVALRVSAAIIGASN